MNKLATRAPLKGRNKAASTVVIILMMVLFSCGQKDKQPARMPARSAPVVRTQPVIMERLVNSIEITGTVEANIFSNVTSPANGVIELLTARENERVEKGRIIAVINPDERVSLISSNQLRVEELEKKLASANESSSEFKQLLDDLERAKKDLDYASGMYQTLPVICPMSGVITHRWLDEGSHVDSRQKIVTISDMTSLVIKAEVNETYFNAVRKNTRLQLMLNAYPNDTLTGIISLVYPQIDPVTRTVKFDIRLLNNNRRVIPGMMATIRIPVSIREEALTVPEEVVLTSPDNKSFLFVADSDSVAHRRIVERGMVSGNRLEIVDGVSLNEIIVVSGQEMLNDKMKVRIIK